jgi:uncharacterized protein YndB with AHSA1/START domain
MIGRPGIVSKEADGFKVIFVRLLNYNSMTVWDAITNPKKMAVWFLETEMELKPGAKMVIHFNDEGKTVTYGKVTKVEQGKLFEYLWENPDGPDEITRWEIIPETSSTCRLLLTHSRIDESYANRVPAGWHIMLNHLEDVLMGREEIYPSGDRDSDEEKAIKTFYKDLVLKTFTLNQISMGTAVITIEKIYDAPVDRVWKAISDKNEMKQWYFDIPEFKAEIGFEFQFYGEGKAGEKFLHLCKITDVVKNKKLRHSWRYDGYEGNSSVTFELIDEGGKTRLKLTHEGLETFPGTANNDFGKENFEKGWTYITGVALKEYVEKKLTT